MKNLRFAQASSWVGLCAILALCALLSGGNGGNGGNGRNGRNGRPEVTRSGTTAAAKPASPAVAKPAEPKQHQTPELKIFGLTPGMSRAEVEALWGKGNDEIDEGVLYKQSASHEFHHVSYDTRDIAVAVTGNILDINGQKISAVTEIDLHSVLRKHLGPSSVHGRIHPPEYPELGLKVEQWDVVGYCFVLERPPAHSSSSP